MISISVRHRRPGSAWHSNALEVTEVRYPRRRRIRFALDRGDVVVELTPQHAIRLIDAVADLLEGQT